MLEAAAVVDHDHLRAGAAQGRAHLLEQHRFARSRLPADRDIVVARVVLERRPEEGLAAPPDEQQVRMGASKILTLHRCDIGGSGRQDGLEPLQPLHVGPEPVG